MPRMKEIVDYLADDTGEEQKHGYLIDIPQQDWTTDIFIDLQPGNYVQLKKENGEWKLATSLPAAVNQPKKKTVRKPKE